MKFKASKEKTSADKSPASAFAALVPSDFAAVPPDVRNGFAFPQKRQFFFGLRPFICSRKNSFSERLQLHKIDERAQPGFLSYRCGRAEPFRTSGGTAAERISKAIITTRHHFLTYFFAFLLCLTAFAQTQPDPNLLAAQSYLQQKNFAKAIAALELVFQTQDKPPDVAYGLMATAQLNQGNKEQALLFTERGLAAHPASTKLAEFYVALLADVATADETKTKLEQMVERQPRSIIFRKALARLLSNSSAQADALFAGLAKDLPRDAETHYLYAQWACVNDKNDLCVAESTKALTLSGANAEAAMQLHTLRAMAFDALNRVPQAEASFRQALTANRKLPKPSPHATFKFIEFLTKRNREAGAQTLNDELLKSFPDFGEAHFERAKFLTKQKRNADAVTAAKRALSLLESDPKQAKAIHAFLAKTYFAMGQTTDAEYHQKAVESMK
jgi:tetratricopeptide (TPR) repeat protein